MGKRIFAVIADGFEEMELICVADVAKRLGIEVVLASLGDNLNVCGAHQMIIVCDSKLENIDFANFDGVFLPGGMPGSMNLYGSDFLREILQKMNEDKKLLSAICAAPMVLSRAGVLANRKFTMYPGLEKFLNKECFSSDLLVTSDNIVTGKGPGAAVKMGFAIAEYLGVDSEAIENMKKAMFLI